MTKIRNLFFALGVIAILIMICTIDVTWADVTKMLRRAGLWFPAVILLWLPIYMINARAWQIIINDGEADRVGYWRVLKYTISGYALNSVTPMGLMGGEPYRVTELTPYVGVAKATSSVILYAMMHIFAHFCFWAFSIVLFLLTFRGHITPSAAFMLLCVAIFCFIGIYFFLLGYRNGLAMRTLRLLRHLPFAGKRINAFIEEHTEGVNRVDEQIAALHAQRRSTFYQSLALEFTGRLVWCFEIMFILLIFVDVHSVAQGFLLFRNALLIQAFASLFANLMFFIPMQMGTREGGMALVTGRLHMPGAYGVLTGLITRLREMVWIAIGLLLIHIGNKKR